jgi:hypothetical protein
MSSRPESPIKQTFKRLLSPNKSSKQQPQLQPPQQEALSPQLPEHTNWTYPESTSSSNFSSDSSQYTGWNIIDRPQTPVSGANKENVHVMDVVNHVMGPTSNKLHKLKSKTNPKSQDADLDRQFEELMVHNPLDYNLLTWAEFPIYSN